MLEAMRNARFAVVLVRRRHPSVGLIVTDLFRNIELWLVDEGLEISLPGWSCVCDPVLHARSFCHDGRRRHADRSPPGHRRCSNWRRNCCASRRSRPSRIGASRKPSIEPPLRTGSWKGSPTRTFPVPAMRPEGSCRKVGVTYNEVALPSIKMDSMCPSYRYDRPCHRARSYPPARVFSQAPLQRAAVRLAERPRVDVQWWIKPVELDPPSARPMCAAFVESSATARHESSMIAGRLGTARHSSSIAACAYSSLASAVLARPP